jgi:hypothetical protein
MSESKRLCRHWVLASLWAKPLFDTLSKVRFLPRETSLGYDILPAITRLWASTDIRLFHTVTTPRYFELGGYATLPQSVQPWVAAPSLALLGITVVNMTQHLYRITVKPPRQRHHRHDSDAPSLAWLDIYIASRWCCLGSIIIRMTRHLHCTMIKPPRQHHRQHDSTAPSPAWLGIYIAPWPSHLSSVVTIMTRQHRHQHDSTSTSHHGQVISVTPSPIWLGNTVASMTWHLHHVAAKSSR